MGLFLAGGNSIWYSYIPVDLLNLVVLVDLGSLEHPEAQVGRRFQDYHPNQGHPTRI